MKLTKGGILCGFCCVYELLGYCVVVVSSGFSHLILNVKSPDIIKPKVRGEREETGKVVETLSCIYQVNLKRFKKDKQKLK